MEKGKGKQKHVTMDEEPERSVLSLANLKDLSTDKKDSKPHDHGTSPHPGGSSRTIDGNPQRRQRIQQSDITPNPRNGMIDVAPRLPWPPTTSERIRLNKPSTSGARPRTHPSPLRSHLITDDGRGDVLEMVARLEAEKAELEQYKQGRVGRPAASNHPQSKNHTMAEDTAREVSPDGVSGAEVDLTPSVPTGGDLSAEGKGKDRRCVLAKKVVAVGKARVVLIKKGRGGGKVGVKGRDVCRSTLGVEAMEESGATAREAREK